VHHTVAIEANGSEAFQARLCTRFQPRNRDFVMSLDEAAAQFSVGFSEIEIADRAGNHL
jgi:hypothetical protein